MLARQNPRQPGVWVLLGVERFCLSGPGPGSADQPEHRPTNQNPARDKNERQMEATPWDHPVDFLLSQMLLEVSAPEFGGGRGCQVWSPDLVSSCLSLPSS